MAETMTELFTAFTGFREELKASLDKQAKELKANGESSEKTGKRVEEVGEKLVEVKAELDRRAAEIQARIDEVEKLAARPRMGVAAHNGKSIGQQFAESDQIKAMRASAATESGAFSVNGSFFPRAAITSDAGSAGTLVEPQRLPDVVTAPRSRPLLRDLLQVSPTTSGTIEFIEQTGFTNNAAPVAEGAVKPESNLTFAKRTAPVEVIAHWAEITRQIIADAPRLQATLDGEMRAGLELKEDEQFIRGSGSSPNLQGIATHPRVQKYFWATGNNAVLANATIKAKTGDTKLDAIRRAMLTVTVAKYFATGLVLNPIDFADIELLKGGDGHYLWVQVPDGAEMRLWRVPVVESLALNAGEFLTGAFGLGARVWDREDTTVRITDSHADYFIRNKLVMLVEERVALTIERPESFVYGVFNNAPA